MFSALPFHLVGVSHHTAGVEVRERLAFSPAGISALLSAERLASRSALLLSTCNRTELYWSGDHDMEPWFRELARSRGADLTGVLSRCDGSAAVRHLFTVASGLDSQILGESEILGQVRRACEIARESGTFSRDMEEIFGAAVAAGRRVRHETMLGRHPASVGSAAVELGLTLLGEAPARRALVLGAGEVAEGVLRALYERGATDVRLVNRNQERAATLGRAWGLAAAGWSELPALLADADLFVVTTGAKRPCISVTLLAEAVARRPERELVVLDLAVPRNVEPAARGLSGMRLLDLDDLQGICCPAAGDTGAPALAQAEQVLLEELARLDLVMRGRAATPRLAELHRVGAEMARREAAWALERLEGLTEAEREVVRQMAERLVRRVLYPVSRSLRLDEAARDEEPREETREPPRLTTTVIP